jgi:hypothetical protein
MEFDIRVTLKNEDYSISANNETGLTRVHLKNVTVNTILHQIPFDELCYFFENEKVRKDLRGEIARNTMNNIQKRKTEYKTKQIIKQRDKETEMIEEIKDYDGELSLFE